jgi:hypothetical protein
LNEKLQFVASESLLETSLETIWRKLGHK